MDNYKINERGMAIDSLSTISRDDGEKLYRENKITNISKKNGVYNALVDGYETKIELDYIYKLKSFYCSCGSNHACKHTAALYFKARDMKDEALAVPYFNPLIITSRYNVHYLLQNNMFTSLDNKVINEDIFVAKIDELTNMHKKIWHNDGKESDLIEDLRLEVLNLFYNIDLYIDNPINKDALVNIFIHILDNISLSRFNKNVLLNKSIYDVLLNILSKFISTYSECRGVLLKYILSMEEYKEPSIIDILLKRLEYRFLDDEGANILLNMYKDSNYIVTNKEFPIMVKCFSILDLSYQDRLNILLALKTKRIYVIRYICAIYKHINDLEGLKKFIKDNLDLNNITSYFISAKKEELLYGMEYALAYEGKIDKALEVLRRLYIATNNIEYYNKSLLYSNPKVENSYYKDNHYELAYMKLLYNHKEYDLLIEEIRLSGSLDIYKCFEPVLGMLYSDVYSKFYMEYIILNLGFSKNMADYRRLYELASTMIYIGSKKEYIEAIIYELDNSYNDNRELVMEFEPIREYLR